MSAKFTTLALAALLLGGLVWTSPAAAARPFRGYFGDYNQTFYYGRPSTAYQRTYQNQNNYYPNVRYPYYNNYGGRYVNPNPGYGAPNVLPLAPGMR